MADQGKATSASVDGGSAMRRLGVVVIAVLAVVQVVAELGWAVHWIGAGRTDMRRGVLFLPFVGLLELARGGFVASIGLAFALFAWAALTGRRWAWSMGLAAVLLTAFGVVVLLALGESLVQIALRAAIPAVVLCYLLTPGGKLALGSGRRGEGEGVVAGNRAA